MHKKKFKFTPAQLKWLEALESGKFRKVTGVLHTYGYKNHQYCCLGITCKIFAAPLKLTCVINDDDSRRYNGEDTSLPNEVQSHLNLRSDMGSIETKKVSQSEEKDILEMTKNLCACNLAGANDGGWSHKKIAAFIRKYPEAVFTNNDKK